MNISRFNTGSDYEVNNRERSTSCYYLENAFLSQKWEQSQTDIRSHRRLITGGREKPLLGTTDV